MLIDTKIGVSVLLERVSGDAQDWRVEDWRLIGVMVDPPNRQYDDIFCEPMRAGDDHAYIWRGLAVHFYKDGGESYWYNLMSEAPRLFVVLEDAREADSAPLPRLVSANQDEAIAHMETDAVVHSIAMPSSIIERLERFVVEHYVPEQKKKRKRQDWRKTQ